MSERPFMQLYVSDFLGDTLDLSTEGIGAYMLLLMAMWNAGGQLPDDEVKLARIARFSLKKWRAVATEILAFFERANGRITHQRLSKELRKSEGKSRSRASAGAAGGAAKALKDKTPPVANATDLPWHLPDTRYQIDKTSAQQSQSSSAAALPGDWLDRSLAANGMGTGFRDERHIGLLSPAPIIGLIEAGFDFERDWLPGVASKPNPKARSWAYFEGQVRDFAAARDKSASVPKPVARPVDWASRLEVYRRDGTWGAWGPKPGEPGCRVPAEFLETRAA